LASCAGWIEIFDSKRVFALGSIERNNLLYFFGCTKSSFALSLLNAAGGKQYFLLPAA
jgi:hypothetical protein